MATATATATGEVTETIDPEPEAIARVAPRRLENGGVVVREIVRRRVRVTGRVQGVWFRASAVREAARLGVGGFARNERDGSVTVEAEGAQVAVDAMVAWCRTGPPRAEVTGVEVEHVAPLGTSVFSSR